MTAGRWLARDHPAITSPADWNMGLALEYVRFVSQKCVGDDLAVPRLLPRMGEQLCAGSKLGLLTTVRCFFHDLHQWEWISRSFNPDRGFAAPRQLTRARHVNPRPIDDAYWFKLRAASLGLQPADLPNNGRSRGFPYPFELTQAVATTWTFSGCRANEIERLEVGCVHIEHVPEQINTSTGQIEPAFTQPMLRVPVNKTRGEFIKPIEEPMAQAIATWELVRPAQARVIDPTTGQLTAYLFCYRGVRIGRGFINDTIIPLLLRKANLPSHDSRGKITCHRGRATLATKLYNNSSGLTSLEIMTWLGHAKLSSGQHYIELTPKRLITSFHRSAKLTENIRSVSVLVDRYAEGTPVFRYDIGHGWCTNDAYASCAHRMACAKCMFYEPAESFGKALAAQSDRYVHMLQELILTDDERAAVTGDEEAIRKLLVRLAAEPVPAVA
jgi:integrase